MGATNDKISVLFVISCCNYVTPDCARSSNEAYTAYPREAGLLLTDGAVMRVLGVERDVKINNLNPNM